MVKVAIVGFGNIGKAVYDAISVSEDFSLKCIVEINEIGMTMNVPQLRNISEIDGVDVAILSLPSRLVPDTALSFCLGNLHRRWL